MKLLKVTHLEIRIATTEIRKYPSVPPISFCVQLLSDEFSPDKRQTNENIYFVLTNTLNLTVAAPGSFESKRKSGVTQVNLLVFGTIKTHQRRK